MPVRAVWGLDWLMATVVAFAVSRAQTGPIGRDLDVYLTGARLLTDGDLYAWTNARGLGFTYPPFAAMLFQPLAWAADGIGLVAAQAIMVALSGAAAVVIVRCSLASVLEGAPERTPRWLTRPWAPSLLVLLASVTVVALDNMHVLNLSLVLTAMVVADHLGPVPARWRGVLTGVAAAVKITPLAFVLLFALTGRVRAAVRAGLVFVALSGVCWLVFPEESTEYWTSALWNSDRVGEISVRVNTALAGVWARAGYPQVWLWMGCALAVVLASYAVARLYRRDRIVGVAVVGMMTATVPPVTWSHHWGWAVVAGILVLARWGPQWALVWGLPFWALPWLRPVLFGRLPEPGWGVALLSGSLTVWFLALLTALALPAVVPALRGQGRPGR